MMNAIFVPFCRFMIFVLLLDRYKVKKGRGMGGGKQAQGAQSSTEWETKYKCLQSTQSLVVHHGKKWNEHREQSERKWENNYNVVTLISIIL